MSQTLFSALLKHWRRRRGMSQLDLALAADVSARHVSFLESGRAQPSEAMVLRLFGVLEAPLRDQNECLRAAGFAPRFPDTEFSSFDSDIEAVVMRMMKQQEPFPLTVMDAGYNIIRANDAALRIFRSFCQEPPSPVETVNLFEIVFAPERARRFIQNWQQLGSAMVTRLHHEALRKSDDTRLWSLLDRVLAYPDVPCDWKNFNIENDESPICPLILANDTVILTFVMTVTAFSAPRHVAVEEMRVESYFPLNAETEAYCRTVADSGWWD
jgi:transcriptional regulator with XRE-family HTH domain